MGFHKTKKIRRLQKMVPQITYDKKTKRILIEYKKVKRENAVYALK